MNTNIRQIVNFHQKCGGDANLGAISPSRPVPHVFHPPNPPIASQSISRDAAFYQAPAALRLPQTVAFQRSPSPKGEGLVDLLLRGHFHPPTPAHAKTCAFACEHRLKCSFQARLFFLIRSSLVQSKRARVKEHRLSENTMDLVCRLPRAQGLTRLIPLIWCARSASKGAQQPSRPFSPHRAGCEDGWAGWRQHPHIQYRRFSFIMLAFLATFLIGNSTASAFCGFYVAKADSKLFNKASEVAVARADDKTVITMANDFKGDVKEFALVVPVPTVLEKGQIHVGDAAVLKHLGDYSAPRLVEYFDANPCRLLRPESRSMDSMAKSGTAPLREREKALGVTVEAQYTVGEYDILILSAHESAGLETRLTEHGYRIPGSASPVLHSYIKQNLKFFVAKVNLGEQAKLGLTHLRPLQIAFESPKFMLPIRLGTVNADGSQELFVYFLTRQGRVETTNYRSVRVPQAQEIPLYVKDRFGDFYRDLFAQQVKREQYRGVFLEYAWDMNWCDPCAADPLSTKELRSLGVFWLDADGRSGKGPQAQNAFLTRLHVRYDASHFPEDLLFQETSDRTNFQARYILRHPWTGADDCAAAAAYREQLDGRHEQQAQTLATLTGWNITEIRKAMNLAARPVQDQRTWYERLWIN